MRNEQQRQVAATNLANQPAVIQRGDHGLTGARGGDDQVAVAIV